MIWDEEMRRESIRSMRGLSFGSVERLCGTDK